MKEKRMSDLMRQCEIALLITKKNGCYSKHELAEKFYVDDSRIKRDMMELRGEGVNIYSRKGKYKIEWSDGLCELFKFYIKFSTDFLNIKNEYITTEIIDKTMLLKQAFESKNKLEIQHDGLWKIVTPRCLKNKEDGFYLVAERYGHEEEIALTQIQAMRIDGSIHYFTMDNTTD